VDDKLVTFIEFVAVSRTGVTNCVLLYV